MQPRREKLSDLLHGNALPAPNTLRPILYGAIAAVLGAVAVVMAVQNHGLRTAHVIPVIGALVGIAIIRRGGYGKKLALLAAGVTLASIVATHVATFSVVTAAWCTKSNYLDVQGNAEAWQKLPSKTDEQLRQFAQEQGFPFTTREAFEDYPGKMLTWFAETDPGYEEWRQWEIDHASFGEYLAYGTSLVDYVMLALTLGIAAAIVAIRTVQLEDRAKQRLLAERQQASRDHSDTPDA